jgi:hypothetical protein
MLPLSFTHVVKEAEIKRRAERLEVQAGHLRCTTGPTSVMTPKPSFSMSFVRLEYN